LVHKKKKLGGFLMANIGRRGTILAVKQSKQRKGEILQRFSADSSQEGKIKKLRYINAKFSGGVC